MVLLEFGSPLKICFAETRQKKKRKRNSLNACHHKPNNSLCRMQDHGSHTLFVIGQCGFGATCRQVPQSYCAVMTSGHNLATEEKTRQIRAKRKMCPSQMVLLQTQNSFSSFHSYLAYLPNLHNWIPPNIRCHLYRYSTNLHHPPTHTTFTLKQHGIKVQHKNNQRGKTTC